MILSEPPRTAWDLNFQLFGVPVRVHPFFWLAMVLLGTNSETTPKQALLWIGAAFVSILVHEFGHVAAINFYGAPARVVLHGFGGLAIQDSYRRRDPKSQIVISLAGPVAGFLFAGLILLGLMAAGSQVEPYNAGPPGFVFFAFEPLSSSTLNELVLYLLLFNIYWGMFNLLPIFPLDGGNVSMSLFELYGGRDGTRKALQLSIGTAALLAVYSLTHGDTFLALFCGYLAFNSYQTLQGQGRYPRSPW